ncbi:MAG: LON peptidase substrate-binding domain-containing protein, partial [Spirochaetes bacterium]|nr:LON peptidase substrate-binding domain-containing protein [Spirochaetota bacterium]
MAEYNQNNQNNHKDQDTSPKELVLSREILPETLPILPITQRPVFPGMMIPIIISGEKMTNTMNTILGSDNKIGGVVLAANTVEDKPALSDSLYKVGVSVRIIKITPIEGNTFQVMITALKRFTLAEIVQDEPIIKWKVTHYYGDDNIKVTQELKTYSLAIIASIKELVKSNSLFQEEMKLFLNRFSIEDPGKLADFVASMTSAEPAKVQEILETFDIKKRAEKVLILLKEELEMSKLQSKITKQIEQQITKNQKEFFLREQLKQIKKELGLTKDEKATEIEEYEERIKKLHLSDEAKNRVDEEMDKIKHLEPRSPEYSVSKNYLDWLTVLPWGIYSEDNYEIKKAKKILDRDHYGLDDIKDRILEFISIGKMKGNISGSILCFIGP